MTDRRQLKLNIKNNVEFFFQLKNLQTNKTINHTFSQLFFFLQTNDFFSKRFFPNVVVELCSDLLSQFPRRVLLVVTFSLKWGGGNLGQKKIQFRYS